MRAHPLDHPFTPLVGALVILFVPEGEQATLIRCMATVFAVSASSISLPSWFDFDPNGPARLPVRRRRTSPGSRRSARVPLRHRRHLLLLIMLTTLMGFIAILSSWTAIEDRVKEYYAMFLLLQTGMLGVFCALDFFLFLRLLGNRAGADVLHHRHLGRPAQLYAAIKFFLYTLAGSVLMLLGILTLYFQHYDGSPASTPSRSRT